MDNKIDTLTRAPSSMELDALKHVQPMYANKSYISSGREGIIRLHFADVDDIDAPNVVKGVEGVVLTLPSLFMLQALIADFIKRNTAGLAGRADIVDINEAKKERESLN